jgi:hypothetical protein
MPDPHEPRPSTPTPGIVTLTVLLTLLTGIFAGVVAILALSDSGPMDHSAAGLALIASALAFGLLANALLRD